MTVLTSVGPLSTWVAEICNILGPSAVHASVVTSVSVHMLTFVVNCGASDNHSKRVDILKRKRKKERYIFTISEWIFVRKKRELLLIYLGKNNVRIRR